MGDGEFVLGGRPIEASGGVVRGPEGQLAGSALTMIDAVRNLHGLGIDAGRRAAGGVDGPGDSASGAPTSAGSRPARPPTSSCSTTGWRSCACWWREATVSLARAEMAEQPAVLERLLRDPAIAAAAAEIERRRPRFAVIAARGSSDNAARYAQHVFGRFWGLPVALATPSLHTLYDAPMRYDDALVIGISQSGASPDVAAVVAAATEQGALTIAITNEPDSRLGTAARHVIDLRTGPERSVAATKTYTASLGAVAALVGDVSAIPDAMARQLRPRRAPSRSGSGSR